MNPDATLSAVVLTRNSSALLERCLQSLKFADELIVIDDFSTDETAEISARCGAKVVKHAMNGDFAAQRRFGIEQCGCKWVLFIDSDEFVSDELAEQIKHVLQGGEKAAYLLKRENSFPHYDITHGSMRSDCVLRLFPKEGLKYNPIKRDWDRDIMAAFGLPERIFPPIDMPGTIRGRLRSDIARELGINCAAFAAVGTHDTASAVAAIPGSGSFAFCSSGTWSVFGIETDLPLLTDEVRDAGFSNEGTVQGGFRPLKNIMGLWLIQECRREWQAEGISLSWDEIVREAEAAEPFRSIIDTDHPPFFSGGHMRQKIRQFCAATNQPLPDTVGSFARCIYESLALKYRYTLERLGEIKGHAIESLNIVGGGSRNRLLNRFAADAAGCRVITGPIEGAAIGNLLVQAMALGDISGIDELRDIVRRCEAVECYEPNTTAEWEAAYGRLLGYMERSGKK